jgi:hypothetical protein
MVCEQMTLPSKHAGLRLRCTSALECHAAYMSSAARTQIAMSEGPEIPALPGIVHGRPGIQMLCPSRRCSGARGLGAMVAAEGGMQLAYRGCSARRS